MGVPFHEVRQWSAAEISLYMAYYHIAPWGDDREDLRNAMNMQLLAAVHGNERTIDDFMPFKDKPEKTGGANPALRAHLMAIARRSKS